MTAHFIARSIRCTSLALLAAIPLAGNAAAGDGQPEGVLVIAGGGIRSGNASLHRAFIDAMPEGAPGRVAIVAAASGSPVDTAARFRETLIAYGVAPGAISVVELAVNDDPSTPEVDESRWANNAYDPAEIAKIEAADAIWLSGGDQSRLSAVLLADDGSATPMLEAMRRRYAAGAVIGGTSAGAAVMSNPMITGGDSLAALIDMDGAGEPLTIGAGLGFFAGGLVDQHFDERARLGRLLVALQRFESKRRLGFGVGEDTALVYDGSNNAITVVGTGHVTVVDARSARWHSSDSGTSIAELRLSILSPGDTLDLDDGAFTPAPYLKPTVGNEYHDREPIAGGGIAVAFSGLANLLGEELLDNAGAQSLERLSFVLQQSTEEPAHRRAGAGVSFTFIQTPESQGYWGHGPDGAGRYSIRNVSLTVVPISLTIAPASRHEE